MQHQIRATRINWGELKVFLVFTATTERSPPGLDESLIVVTDGLSHLAVLETDFHSTALWHYQTASLKCRRKSLRALCLSLPELGTETAIVTSVATIFHPSILPIFHVAGNRCCETTLQSVALQGLMNLRKSLLTWSVRRLAPSDSFLP